MPKLTLELGGKAANILFEDAPLDQAIEGVIAEIYSTVIKNCATASRRCAPVIRSTTKLI